MDAEHDSECNNDDELAPMVDGLSGALCIFILITTFFMISGIDTVVTSLGSRYQLEKSRYNQNTQTIYFNQVVSLPQDIYSQINNDINNNRSEGRKIIIEAYKNDYSNIGNRERKQLIYNMIDFQQKINADKLRVTLKISDHNFCNTNDSCIKWGVY